jgi:hypothetical protein
MAATVAEVEDFTEGVVVFTVAVPEGFTVAGAIPAITAGVATTEAIAEAVITGAITAVDTMAGTEATTAGAADIGAIQSMVTDGDLDSGGHMGGDTLTDIATAPGGTLPILTILRTIARRAIPALPMETTIHRNRIRCQTIRTIPQSPGDLPVREAMRAEIARPGKWKLLSGIPRFSLLII